MSFLNKGRINLVLTNQHIRYIQGSSIDHLHDYGEIELPKGTIIDGMIVNKMVLKDILTHLVKEKKWRRSRLFFTVPDDTVAIRELQVPVSLTKEEALSYVTIQLGKSFYLPFPDPVIAIDLLEAEGDKQSLLLYAYPKKQITDFQDVFEEVGLKPVVADLTALSVYRYYYQSSQTKQNHVLLLHWNSDSLVITAFKQHRAVFSRYLKMSERLGGQFNDEDMNEHQAIDIINDLLIEINRILDFYQFSITQGESAIAQLLLSGDFIFMELLHKRLNDEINIPIYDYKSGHIPVELPNKFIDVLGLTLKQEI